MRWSRMAGLSSTLACCALAAVVWSLAQGAPSPGAGAGEAVAAPANRAPVLGVLPDRVSVRAGERAHVVVEALDPDTEEDGSAEAVWLGAAPRTGLAPAWLGESWSAGPSGQPRLELVFAPPADAPPGSHVIEAGATDARGLSALGRFVVTVLPPKCGPLEIEDGGVCLGCPEHRLPDGSRAFCEPCPAGTERPAGSPSCTDCPVGEASRGGAACAPRPTAPKAAAAPASATAKSSTVPDTTAPTIAAAHYAGSTVTLTLSEPVWAELPAAGNDFPVRSGVVYAVAAVGMASREADASEVITLTLGQAVTGSAEVLVSYVPNGAAKRRPRDAAGNRMKFHTVAVQPRRTLAVSFDGADESGIAEDAGEVGATVSLDNPPASGGYTGCGLRLAAGGAADAADVAFINGSQALNPGNGWRAADVKLLRVVDDALAEGDEALAVEAFCTGSAAGTSPAASGLASEPVRVTLADNESRTITLSATPDSVPETAAATRVTVAATLDGAATDRLELALTLSGTAAADRYTVTGVKRIAIEAGATGGSTVLTVDPDADADDADQAIAIGSTLAGYSVAGVAVTLAEPPPPPTLVAGVDSATLAEDIGKVNVRLTLSNPPATGKYTGCRLRLGTGSEAETPADVTFSNQKKLTAENGWTAQAGFMTVVDDTVAEGDEALVVEGHCTGSKSGTEPAHTALASKPLALTITDNDAAAQPLTLSVSPDAIGETLGAQEVEVTATLGAVPPSPVTVDLSLGSGSYTVTGTQRITLPKGSASGSTTLAFTPRDDGNTSDDTVAVGGAASGHAVTGTDLTITEPRTVGGADLSGLAVGLAASPTAIREGTAGDHTLSAKLNGVDVPSVDVAMVLAVGGTATEGSSHDYTLAGKADWKELTVAANDAHLSASAKVKVTALADASDEGEETVTFSVGQVTWGGTVVALKEPAVATLRITEAWEKPAAPKGLGAAPAPGNETHGLDVSWTAVTATPPVDGYVVRHREVANPPAAWRESEQQPGTAEALTGLSAGTRHELRVFARNAAGDGAESGSVFVRTADGGCPMAAPSVAASTGSRSSTALEASWQAPACGAAVASYRVRYREDPDVENVENGWTEIAASGTAATVTGLVPDTAYVVAVRAVAIGGDKGPWSPEGKGRTGLDVRLPPRMGAPSVAPHSVDGASRLEATWTRVTWTDGNDTAHPITEYQYRHRPAGGDWTAETDAQATAQEATAMTRPIAGLSAGTWHEVQVRAVNRMDGAAHPGKWSEPGRGRTWGAPDPVEEPAAFLTDAAVEVVWEAPHDGGSAITGYDVEHKVRDQGGWTPHPYAGCGVGACATETSIKALARKVRVRAENALGMGGWSPTARVQQRKLLRVSYGAAAAAVTEGESLLVTARLDGSADRAVAAPVTTAGDAAPFRLDGLGANHTLAFGLGTDEQTFTFVALQDPDDADGKVTLGFGTLPDGVRLKAPASLVVTINDDESANGSPVFDAGAAATRTVAENAAAGTAVGAPVTARDPDDDALAYTLAGTHAALFSVDAASGQIKVGADADLDFEGAVTGYALRVQASDGKDGAGTADSAVDASIAVTVNVTDVAEPPGTPDAPALVPAADSLAVAWKEPDNTGPAITGYDLHYRASGEVGWTDARVAGTKTSATLGGLASGTAHEVRVRAGSDEGAGGWSASAEGNTLPAASLTADALKPEIADGNAAVAVTLSGRAEAAGGGTLKGAWLERDGEGAVTVLADGIALASGVAVTRTASSSAPGMRTFGFRATHSLDGRTGESTEWIGIEWRPKVVLSAAPASVPEDGGAAQVTVTATLTGSSVTKAAKTVTVSVAGGTATVDDDFTAVKDFTISIPGEVRSADGSFTLTPVADSAREGPETVAVSGTATDGNAITVTGTAVRIVDADPKLTVASPSNGRVTGTTGSGDAQRTVIDCGSGSRTDCSASLPGGTLVTLSAAADAGHLFDGWTGACSGTADCALTLNADSAVGARFVAARTLTVTAPAHGKVVGKVGTATVIDCGSDCAETVADGTKVALSASAADGHRFDAWGGACAAEASANCLLTLTADRAVSAAFASTAVVGKCDNSVVDGCEAGTLNGAAFKDTDATHHWRCDGSGGGADSPRCGKAKRGCSGGARDWSVGANDCSGPVAGGASGQVRAATDGSGSVTGSASFKCDDGAWTEQFGATCTACTAVNGGWTTAAYGGWGACSAIACGQSGTRSRSWSRTCTNPAPSCGGAACSGAASGTQNEACTGSSPRNGGWSGWGACSATACGATGTQTRTCTNPSPGCDGEGCSGSTTQSCTGSNPRDGGWSGWGACSATACGATGTQTRTCTNPPPGCDGEGCSGSTTQSCTGSNPRDGGWSGWGACSATACGATGTQTRTCTNPSPGCDGEGCSGSTTQSCTGSNPRDGGWSGWGACSATACGATGTQTRTCTNPPPGCDGEGCSGSTTQSCTGSNPRDGGWSDKAYSNWSACSATQCGTSGQKTRTWTRTCTNPSPGCGGDGCTGNASGSETQSCNAPACPALTAEAGGPYTATFVGGHVPNGSFSYYFAFVTATAAGGVSPYTFNWSGQPTGATATYLYGTAGNYAETVTVTDSIRAKDSDTASISARTPGIRGAASDTRSFEVRVGEELVFVWGGAGAVAARSEDASIITVRVASPVIRVRGVGAGTANAVVETDDGDLPITVVVK